jgi:hypothetical protein
MAITASVYSRLQFNFDFPEGNELTLSDGAVKSLETMPKLLEDWQVNDIGNNDVTGYYNNPVANITISIRTTSNTIAGILAASPSTNSNAVVGSTTEITNLFTNTLVTLANVANTLTSNSEGALFLDHTDRISGIIEQGPQEETGRDTSDLPHFQEAIGIGRVLTYVIFQTDGISNTSVQTGSFTSLFVQNTLSELSNTLALYPNLITNSLTITGTGIEADPFVRTSNLSLSQVQTLSNTANTIFTTFKTRREHDVNFFQNAKRVLDDYGKAAYFTKTGETQNNLIIDFVGSDKIKSNTRLGAA